MSALLGGTRITSAAWLAAQALLVRFISTYGSERYHQLYAGRSLIGVTASPSQRSVQGILVPSDWPEPLQLVAVTPEDRLTDFGPDLPERPYNRVKIGWTTSGWTDARWIEVISGLTPGGAVDLANVLEKIPFEGDQTYSYITPPLEGSGMWFFEIAGRDDAEPDGNRGTPLALHQPIVAHPPDIALQDDGSRLAVAIAAAAAAVTFAYA